MQSIRAFSTTCRCSSHIGKSRIPVPSTVLVSRAENTISVVGPLGTQKLSVPSFLQWTSGAPLPKTLARNPDADIVSELAVSVYDPTKKLQKSQWGLFRSLIANAIKGVSEGYTLPIRCNGVGYRFTVEGNELHGKLGYPKITVWPIPEGISIKQNSQTEIILSGIDKQKVGQFAATIRKVRKPEPYNLKGIFVGNETIKKKTPRKR